MKHTQYPLICRIITLNQIHKGLFLVDSSIRIRNNVDYISPTKPGLYTRMKSRINPERPAIQASPEVIHMIYGLDIPKRKRQFDIYENRQKPENKPDQNVYRQVVIKEHI
jgi:hypothetical protein